MATVVSFPFADMTLATNQFDEHSLGCAFNTRTGRVTAPLFFFPPGEDGTEQILLTSEPGATTISRQQICTTTDKTNEFLGINGKLSVHFAMIGGEGRGSWQTEDSTSSTTFTVFQTCTHIVGQSCINKSALARIMTTPAAHHFLHPDLQTPETAQAFIDAQGTQFVTAVKKGGIVIRRIRYTCATAQQAKYLRSQISGSLPVGPALAEVEFSVNIETRAAGGDPTVFQFTTDLEEARHQERAWQCSVHLAGDDGVCDTTVAVAAELDDVGQTFIPALTWTDHQLRAYVCILRT